MAEFDRKSVVRDLMILTPLFRKKFLKRKGPEPFAGLSKSQHHVIRSLSLFPSMNMGQLASDADVSLQQITKTVNALEDMGYVRRYTDRSNRRQVWVSLTDECWEILRKHSDANDGILVKSFDSLSDEDMKTLQQAARTIQTVLGKMEDRVTPDKEK